ncbi:MAG: hypothetical protein M3Q44_00280 [bacterium]|nr:hypothetical protein [bacterium]
MKNSLKLAILLFVISSLITLVWFNAGKTLATGESGLPFYNTQGLLSFQKNTWSQGALGLPSGAALASYPFLLSIIFFHNLGVPDVYMQAGFFLMCLFISQLYTARLVKIMIPHEHNENYIFYLFASLLYVTNLFSMANIWNRFQYTFIIFYSLVPFILFSSIKLFKNRSYLSGLCLIIVTTFFSIAFSSIPLMVLLWTLIIFIGLMESILSNSLKVMRYILISLMTLLLLWMAANAWWMMPFIKTLTSSSYLTQTAYSSVGNFETFLQMSENLGNFSYIFRLMHKDFFNNIAPVWGNFYNQPVGILLTYLPVILALYPLTRKITNRFLYIFLFMALFGIFLAKGSGPPFGFIFIFLFENIKIIESLRNPFEKIGLFIPVSYAALSGYSLYVILENLKKKKKFGALVIIVLMVIIILPYPFWSGLLFTGTFHPQNNPEIGYKTEVPSYYKDADKYLANDPNPFRLIAVPLKGEGINYKWEYGYAGVELYNGLFSRPAISFATSIQFYTPIANQVEQIAMLYPERLIQMMQILNAKYLIVRNDVDHAIREMTPSEELSKKIRSKESQLQLSQSFGKLDFYNSPETGESNKIYIASNVIQYPHTEEYLFTNVLAHSNYNFTDIFVKDTDKIESLNGQLKQKIYTPVVKETDQDISSIGTDFIPVEVPVVSRDNALLELPHVSTLPDSRMYFFAHIREQIMRSNKKQIWSDKQFDTLRFAGKRLVETYKLIEKKASPDLITKSSDEYYKNLMQVERGYILSFKGIPAELMRHKHVIDMIKQHGVNSNKFDGLRKSDEYLSIIFDKGIPLNGVANVKVKRSKYLISVDESKAYQLQLKLISNKEIPEYKEVLINDNKYIINNGIFRDEVNLNQGINVVDIPINKISPNISDEIQNIAVSVVDNDFSPISNQKPHMTFTMLNSAKYKVHIKNATAPYTLVLSESFHPLWKAKINGQKEIQSGNHFLVNSYANAWHITDTGEYDIEIEFGAEGSFRLGKIVTFITVTGLFLAIGAILVKNKQKAGTKKNVS